MTTTPRQRGEARFAVENVGGIAETEVNVPPGVTVLTGRNATNRTSFLQAIAAATGSRRATLKGDAESGRVRAEIDGESYERTLERTADGVAFGGEGYLDDPEVADLFAFLLGDNEARRSVVYGEDLRELIMRPVDTERIREEIARLREEKGEINDELADIESRKRDLPDLEREREEIQREIEDQRAALAEIETEIDEEEREPAEGRRVEDELQDRLDDLAEVRSEIESVRQEIERESASLGEARSERSEVADDLDELPEDPGADGRNLDARLDDLRSRRQRLNGEISELQNLLQYNRELLEDGDGVPVRGLDAVGVTGNGESAENGAGDAVTDRLLESESGTVTCWTCGSSVERSQIEETVGRLEELRSRKVTELDEVSSELDDLKAQRREVKRARERREEAERRLSELDDEIERRERRIETLEQRRADLGGEVEELEAAVEDLESEEFSAVLDLHREANELEFEIERLEDDLADVVDEIEEIEGLLERADELRERREEVVDELADRRTRIDRIEAEAVDSFNEHMDALLEVLGYDNLDRIWIDRVEETAREGRETVRRTDFDLNVVRTTDNGAAYRDTVDHLSESEREVTGLVFALAGYLVHDLHETVPFMLLDSLEAIDADRIAALVDYFADFAPYLVVALLPEDARALDEAYTRIREI